MSYTAVQTDPLMVTFVSVCSRSCDDLHVHTPPVTKVLLIEILSQSNAS